jgi:hypothetical protein
MHVAMHVASPQQAKPSVLPRAQLPQFRSWVSDGSLSDCQRCGEQLRLVNECCLLRDVISKLPCGVHRVEWLFWALCGSPCSHAYAYAYAYVHLLLLTSCLPDSFTLVIT